jgi:hypothetical protein
MAAVIKPIASASPPAALDAYPAPSRWYDWAAGVLAAALVGGAYLDGWAHRHEKVDDSFFTPWHGVLYGGYLLSAVFLLVSVRYFRARGHARQRSLPRGYGLALLGVVVFAAGGLGDMIWHSVLGIEVDVEQLLSPTHLMLSAGAALIACGPVRSVWQRLPVGTSPDWRMAGPAILGVAAVIAVLAFMTQYAHPLIDTLAAEQPRSAAARREQYGFLGTESVVQGLGLSGIIIQTTLLMGPVLLLVRRWRLPFGALTALFTLVGLAACALQDQYALLPAAISSGFAADLLSYRLATLRSPGALRLFACLVPVVYYVCYFLALALADRVTWSVHLWTGAIVVAGVTGLLLGIMLTAQPEPS